MNFIDRPKIKNYAGQAVNYAQEKMNGYFLEIYLNRGVHAYFKSRQEDVSPKLDAFSFFHALTNLPDGTILLGELHCPGRPATSVPTMIKNADENLLFTPFAVPVYAGKDMRFVDLEIIDTLLSAHGFGCPAYKKLPADQVLQANQIARLLATAEKKKIEGYVLKKSHVDGWYKLKPDREVDAFVVGHTISASKQFSGGLKSFTVAVFDGEKKVVLADVSAGFDSAFKPGCLPQDHHGRVMEVKFQSVTAAGKLQHPRFIRWRPDKLKQHCCLDQI